MMRKKKDTKGARLGEIVPTCDPFLRGGPPASCLYWRARELAHTHSFFTSFFAPNGDKPAMNTPSSALSPGSSLGASRRQSVGSEGERYAEKWRLHPTRTHRVAQSKPADFCTRTAVLRARTSYFRVAVVLRCGLQYMYR